MEIVVFDTRSYDKNALEEENVHFGFQLRFLEPRLTEETANLAQGSKVACCFVNDRLNKASLAILKEVGIELIALRSAGFNHVDLATAKELDLAIVRVPEYSPYAVAEHALALLLTFNRKTHRAFNRVREMNFSLEGLVGFDLHKKTIGVVGTGKIGATFTRIISGFGARILAYDISQDSHLVSETGLEYVSLDTLYRESDVISLHVPLTPKTHRIVNEEAFSVMKPNAIIINTSRGGLIDTKALIQSLKSRRIAGACLDVYEEEEGVFFSDFSATGIEDDLLARLLTFPNVLITSHQAFLTSEALQNIAHTTLLNIKEFSEGKNLTNRVVS